MQDEAVIEQTAPTTALKPPALGEVWADQGGIYVGLSRGRDGEPDAHLILHVAEADKPLPWDDAKAWAAQVEVDGHKDFHLPERFESALLYANARELMDENSWYWTGTQSSGDASYAWGQLFYYGFQLTSHKSSEGRARAVRRLTA